MHSEEINPKTFASQTQEAGDFWRCKNMKEPTTQTTNRDNSYDQSSFAVTFCKFKETHKAQQSEMDHQHSTAYEPSKTDEERTSSEEEV